MSFGWACRQHVALCRQPLRQRTCLGLLSALHDRYDLHRAATVDLGCWAGLLIWVVDLGWWFCCLWGQVSVAHHLHATQPLSRVAPRCKDGLSCFVEMGFGPGFGCGMACVVYSRKKAISPLAKEWLALQLKRLVWSGTYMCLKMSNVCDGG